MKIEIGESLISSWLRHVKQCRIVQTNWKIASGWNKNTIETDANKALSYRIKHDPGLVGAFDPTADRISPQGEINIIGVDDRNTVYFVISAFNAKDLQYGLPFEPQRSALEAKSHVCIKLWRSYLQSVACFSDKKYRVLFVLPEVKPLTETTINNAVTCLNKYFTAEQCRFYFCTNSNFKNDILIPTLKSTQNESETAEPFLQSCKLLDKFGLIRLPETNAPVFTPPQEPVSGSVSQKQLGAASQSIISSDDPYSNMSIGEIARRVLIPLLDRKTISSNLLRSLQQKEYSHQFFGINYPLLTKLASAGAHIPDRYYRKQTITVNGEHFAVCREWFETSADNDRPKLIAWIQDFQTKHS